jgi:tripartite-type tricarboxylate transporter receptor subunit TctC
MSASRTFFALYVASVALGGAVAHAQDWPARPLTLVVPFGAGGSSDVIGRIVAEGLRVKLGQPVIVENINGAGGMIGASRVAKAAPDGYQLVLGNVGTHGQNQSVYRKPLYDAVTDFAPVALVADQSLVLVARKDFPADNLRDFIAYAKANQGKLQYGSSGVGGSNHLACVLFNAAAGLDVAHVPYRGGGGQAMQDLLAGRIDYQCPSAPVALPQIEGKTVKAIATLGLDRAPGLESLATAEEQGLKGLDCGSWGSLSLPKGTPAAIVNRLAEASNQAVESQALRDQFKRIGVTVPAKERRTMEYLAKFVPSEIERWAKPIKAAGVSEE